jgi:hypothetical protein
MELALAQDVISPSDVLMFQLPKNSQWLLLIAFVDIDNNQGRWDRKLESGRLEISLKKPPGVLHRIPRAELQLP